MKAPVLAQQICMSAATLCAAHNLHVRSAAQSMRAPVATSHAHRRDLSLRRRARNARNSPECRRARKAFAHLQRNPRKQLQNCKTRATLSAREVDSLRYSITTRARHRNALRQESLHQGGQLTASTQIRIQTTQLASSHVDPSTRVLVDHEVASVERGEADDESPPLSHAELLPPFCCTYLARD
jgi:hypothetical protein